MRAFALGLCLLIAGCGGTGINFLDDFDGVVIEPIGKSFSSLGDRVKFEVPANAFAQTVTMTIAEALGLPTLPFILLATAFDVRVTGGVAQKDIGITVAFNPADLGNIAESTLTIFRIVNGDAQAISNPVVDEAANTVTVQVGDPNGTFVVGHQP
ncbi:MAG: hypothetical protein HONBIEJF_00605 [Fimbriimonadaceae bacterium]|nr:hypothetical protein [Fimbriimonadaceae bacterium]